MDTPKVKAYIQRFKEEQRRINSLEWRQQCGIDFDIDGFLSTTVPEKATADEIINLCEDHISVRGAEFYHKKRDTQFSTTLANCKKRLRDEADAAAAAVASDRTLTGAEFLTRYRALPHFLQSYVRGALLGKVDCGGPSAYQIGEPEFWQRYGDVAAPYATDPEKRRKILTLSTKLMTEAEAAAAGGRGKE